MADDTKFMLFSKKYLKKLVKFSILKFKHSTKIYQSYVRKILWDSNAHK